MRSLKNFHHVSLLWLVMLLNVPVYGMKPLQKSVDSLFVIASSGEIRFQAMVQPAIDSIAAMGSGAVPFLIPQLGTSSARERLTVINILKKIGSPAIPELSATLRGANGLAAERAANALGEIGDSAAREVLTEALTHQRWQVREEAVGALGKIKSVAASEAIHTAFADSIGQVRKGAAVAAGRLHLSALIPSLVSLLADPFYGARMAARGSLLALDTIAVISSLRVVVTDTLAAPLAREHALFLLGELHRDQAGSILAESLHAADPATRAAAALGLWASGSTVAQNQVIAWLATEPDSLARLRVRSVMPKSAIK